MKVVPGLFIPFSRWQPQTGRRLEELLQHHFEIYFDLISVSFFPMCVCFLFAYLFGPGVQCQTFLPSFVFSVVFSDRVFGMRPARAFWPAFKFPN